MHPALIHNRVIHNRGGRTRPMVVGSKNWNRGKDAQLLHSDDHWQGRIGRYFDHKKFASQPLNSQCCAAASHDTGTVQIERDRSRAARRRLGRTARADPFCEDLRIRHADAFAAGCAPATSGQAAAAAPPNSVMNSRRLMPNTDFLPRPAAGAAEWPRQPRAGAIGLLHSQPTAGRRPGVSALNAKADDPAGEHVHHHHDPVAAQPAARRCWSIKSVP